MSVCLYVEEKPLTTATERGYVTGERSVFDLISLKDRERLKMAKEKKQFEMDSMSYQHCIVSE